MRLTSFCDRCGSIARLAGIGACETLQSMGGSSEYSRNLAVQERNWPLRCFTEAIYIICIYIIYIMYTYICIYLLIYLY